MKFAQSSVTASRESSFNVFGSGSWKPVLLRHSPSCACSITRETRWRCVWECGSAHNLCPTRSHHLSVMVWVPFKETLLGKCAQFYIQTNKIAGKIFIYSLALAPSYGVFSFSSHFQTILRVHACSTTENVMSHLNEFERTTPELPITTSNGLTFAKPSQIQLRGSIQQWFSALSLQTVFSVHLEVSSSKVSVSIIFKLSVFKPPRASSDFCRKLFPCTSSGEPTIIVSICSPSSKLSLWSVQSSFGPLPSPTFQLC